MKAIGESPANIVAFYAPGFSFRTLYNTDVFPGIFSEFYSILFHHEYDHKFSSLQITYYLFCKNHCVQDSPGLHHKLFFPKAYAGFREF